MAGWGTNGMIRQPRNIADQGQQNILKQLSGALQGTGATVNADGGLTYGYNPAAYAGGTPQREARASVANPPTEQAPTQAVTSPAGGQPLPPANTAGGSETGINTPVVPPTRPPRTETPVVPPNLDTVVNTAVDSSVPAVIPNWANHPGGGVDPATGKMSWGTGTAPRVEQAGGTIVPVPSYGGIWSSLPVGQTPAQYALANGIPAGRLAAFLSQGSTLPGSTPQEVVQNYLHPSGTLDPRWLQQGSG